MSKEPEQAPRRTSSLVLQTNPALLEAYDSLSDGGISSLPTPRLGSDDTNVFEAFTGAVASGSPIQRLPSQRRGFTGFAVPLVAVDAPVLKPPPLQEVVIPKRGENLSRQLSNSVRLHREKPAQVPDRFQDVRDVYMAYDPAMHKTTWDRVKALGKGSFAQVILATPTLSQVKPGLEARARKTLVAVKITTLGADPAEKQQIEEALRRDVALVKQLAHPCLISIIAFNIDSVRALVVLPYCRGGDMFELVAHHIPLHPKLLSRLMFDIVSAVAYMHSKNVVHRDIKLENVLISLNPDELLRIPDYAADPRPLAIVTDLGLARSIDPDSPMLTTRCGSEDYVPPEIILSHPYDGRQTDAWAIGVLLYAALEGRLPFDAPPRTHSQISARARVVKTAHRIARNEWAWYKLKNSPPEYDDLKALVGLCLRKITKDRISTSEMLKLPWLQSAGPDNYTTDQQNPVDLFQQT